MQINSNVSKKALLDKIFKKTRGNECEKEKLVPGSNYLKPDVLQYSNK